MKKYHITIVWPEHAVAGCDPVERYENCTLLPPHEGNFGFLVFQDSNGKECRVSHAFPVRVEEMA